jgi:hypothetical protein
LQHLSNVFGALRVDVTIRYEEVVIWDRGHQGRCISPEMCVNEFLMESEDIRTPYIRIEPALAASQPDGNGDDEEEISVSHG